MLPLNQTEKTNPRANRELINCAFPRFKKLASILVRVLAAPCVLIGHCDDFGVGFMTSSLNALWC